MTDLPELLSQEYDEIHRCHDWMKDNNEPPDAARTRAPKSHWPFDERFAPYLHHSGLLPLARMLDTRHSFTIDGCLLSALTDRWRPETHSFHFRWGEMTVTLQDVSFITGLPIRGGPIVPPPPRNDWKVHLSHRFGVPIEDEVRGVPHNWLRRFQECPAFAPDHIVRNHLIAYLLYIFGWILFPTSHNDIVYPEWIFVAESLVDLPQEDVPPLVSFGSALLCSTYRGLCDASQRKGKTVLCVCHMLLQIWSWEHLPIGRPDIVEHERYDEPQQHTMGSRWTHGRLEWARRKTARSYPQYHLDFEELHESTVIWHPWTVEYIDKMMPHGLAPLCTSDVDFWLTSRNLVFMHMVEPYLPERVMRQFGYHQVVPPPPPRHLFTDVHR